MRNLKSKFVVSTLFTLLAAIYGMEVSGQTKLTDDPLPSKKPTVPPTIMFAVDNTASMKKLFSPHGLTGGRGHWRQGDAHKPETINFDMLNYKHNKLAYNPNITYRPPHNSYRSLPEMSPIDGKWAGNGESASGFYKKIGWPNGSEWGEGRGEDYSDGRFVDMDERYSFSKEFLDKLEKERHFIIPWDYLNDTSNPNVQYVKLDAHGKILGYEIPSFYMGGGGTEMVIMDPRHPVNWNGNKPKPELVNYANWVAYYRDRSSAMRTTISLALTDAFCQTDALNPESPSCRASDLPHIGLAVADVDGYVGKGGRLDPHGFFQQNRQRFLNTLFDMKTDKVLKNFTVLIQDMVWSSSGRGWGAPLEGYIRASCQRNYLLAYSDGDPISGGFPIGAELRSSEKVPENADGLTVYGQTLKAGEKWPSPIYYGPTNNTSANLADAALSIWGKDIRTPFSNGISVAANEENNVPPTEEDPATWQHINFVNIGFGFKNTVDIPSSWSDNAEDAFWHASVNGMAPNGGRVLSQENLEAYTKDLTDLLISITQPPPSGAAGATLSNPNLTDGKQFVFTASYVGNKGDIKRRPISAEAKVGAVDHTASKYFGNVKDRSEWAGKRKIITGSGYGNSQSAVPFEYDNLSATAKGFISAAEVKSLRGDSKAQLGDIVNALPAVVTLPYCMLPEGSTVDFAKAGMADFECVYDEEVNPGYKDFFMAQLGKQKGKSTRETITVYAPANDGMVHAFDGELNELWAYIPSMLFRAKDKGGIGNLAASGKSKHYFYVDATPKMQDIQFDDKGAWQTVLIGGLGKGGAMYYALNVTDQTGSAREKFLWEFTDDHLGYTFARPVIGKTHASSTKEVTWQRTSGAQKWVAILPSGYNNGRGKDSAQDKGDGKGHLYFVDAEKGTLLHKLDLGNGDTGSISSPTNFAYIAGYMEDASDLLVTAVYGSDEKGNLWRANLQSANHQEWSAAKIASWSNSLYVTTKPTITVSDSGKRYVMQGTGGFRNEDDLTRRDTNTFFVIADGNESSVRSGNSVTGRGDLQAVSASAVNGNVTNPNGWYMDLNDGWNFNVEPIAFADLVVFAANKYNVTSGMTDKQKCENSSGFEGRLFVRDLSGNSKLKNIGFVNIPGGIASIEVVRVKGPDGKSHMSIHVQGVDPNTQSTHDVDIDLEKGQKKVDIPERVNIRYITR